MRMKRWRCEQCQTRYLLEDSDLQHRQKPRREMENLTSRWRIVTAIWSILMMIIWYQIIAVVSKVFSVREDNKKASVEKHTMSTTEIRNSDEGRDMFCIRSKIWVSRPKVWAGCFTVAMLNSCEWSVRKSRENVRLPSSIFGVAQLTLHRPNRLSTLTNPTQWKQSLSKVVTW